MQNNMQPAHVKDNFFGNPYKIRETALNLIAQNHSCILNDNKHNYPGVRVPVPEKTSSRIINYLEHELGQGVKNFESEFHITSGVHKLGLIHTDRENCAGLIYLNENPSPHSGTILCNPIISESQLKIVSNFSQASITHDVDVIKSFINYKESYNKNFEIEIELENKFDRFILYNGKQYHAPYHYFGNNLFNSRLVLVFWFNTM